MGANVKKINKKVGNLLRTTKNLQKFTGNTEKLAGLNLAIENDVCCGLGKKILYFVGINGVVRKITKYPLVYNDQIVNNAKELGEQVTKALGTGYIAYVPNTGNVVVLAAPYLKQTDGTLNIEDNIIIRDV